MKRMLFNATHQEELRVAIVEDQKLINFDIETTSKVQRRGNIYKGIITRVEPSLEACFVDYGTEKQGFLPFKEIDAAYLSDTGRYKDFTKLTEGTELIIQIEKDERGNKGAALTTYVSLPGRYLVLMPNNVRGGGISRRIDGEERDELKSVLSELEVPSGMSIIARTAALGRVREELQWDLSYLLKLWEAVKTASSSNAGSFLVYPESSLVIRSIRDHFSPDIGEILIDVPDIFEQAHQFMSHVMPAFVNRIKLYQNDIPLFSRFQIEHQIESAYSRVVHLPSGGSIVIDHTEALTAVDVNSAKANKGSDIEATAFATNLEAADEIARQMRLRDLGGLIVVDFIDMENLRNQREIENFFKQQLGLDRARIQMGKLSKFGLLELSRQRLQASLEESTTVACPRCAGVGIIRGTESTAVHVLRIIQEEVIKNTNYLSALHIQLPVTVATYLLNEKRDDIAKIESRTKVKIVLIPNEYLETPNYKIKKISNEGYDLSSKSYNLVEQGEDIQFNTQVSDKKIRDVAHKAIIKNIVPAMPAPVIKIKPFGLNKLFNKISKLIKNRFLPVPVSLKKIERGVDNTPRPRERQNNYQGNSRNSSNNTTLNKPYNKTRTVGVNRNNAKVQTVRPTPNISKGASNTKGDLLHTLPAERSPEKHNTNEKTIVTPKFMHTTSKAITDSVALEKKVVEKVSLVATKDQKIQPEIKETIVKVEEKVRENTITRAVDLGNFEIISTRSDFIPAVEDCIIEDINLKRHNDRVRENISQINEEIDYQLVETKVL